jgi:hypothetical protein
MKKTATFLIFFFAFKSYAQHSFGDSVKSNVKIRKFYIQTDIASPIFALITNKYWERQSQQQYKSHA